MPYLDGGGVSLFTCSSTTGVVDDGHDNVDACMKILNDSGVALVSIIGID